MLTIKKIDVITDSGGNFEVNTDAAGNASQVPMKTPSGSILRVFYKPGATPIGAASVLEVKEQFSGNLLLSAVVGGGADISLQPREPVHDTAGVAIEGAHDAVLCAGSLDVSISNAGANADAVFYLYIAS